MSHLSIVCQLCTFPGFFPSPYNRSSAIRIRSLLVPLIRNSVTGSCSGCQLIRYCPPCAACGVGEEIDGLADLAEGHIVIGLVALFGVRGLDRDEVLLILRRAVQQEGLRRGRIHLERFDPAFLIGYLEFLLFQRGGLDRLQLVGRFLVLVQASFEAVDGHLRRARGLNIEAQFRGSVEVDPDEVRVVAESDEVLPGASC